MATITTIELDTADYTDFRDETVGAGGVVCEVQIRRVWKTGTLGGNQQQLRNTVATEIAAIQTEITAVTAESARLRDTTVAFTTQQLRNDLARLGDDVARLATDVIRLGKLALGDYTTPGP